MAQMGKSLRQHCRRAVTPLIRLVALGIDDPTVLHWPEREILEHVATI